MRTGSWSMSSACTRVRVWNHHDSRAPARGRPCGRACGRCVRSTMAGRGALGKRLLRTATPALCQVLDGTAWRRQRAQGAAACRARPCRGGRHRAGSELLPPEEPQAIRDASAWGYGREFMLTVLFGPPPTGWVPRRCPRHPRCRWPVAVLVLVTRRRGSGGVVCSGRRRNAQRKTYNWLCCNSCCSCTSGWPLHCMPVPVLLQ